MSSLVDRLEDVRAELVAAGVRATLDPRNVAPPCVLLVPPEVVLDVNCGGTATFQAFAIVPPPANADAWIRADALAAQVAGVVDLESVRPSSYGPDDGGALPAMQCTWTEAIEWPGG